MTKKEATRLLRIYGKAWEKQDPDLILTLFSEDASYKDPEEPENFGHEGIRKYWVSKVQGEQSSIHFKLLHVWADGDTVIAEWDAEFTDTKSNSRIQMTEVAILQIKGGKFSSLREYYKATKIAL